MSAGAPVLRRWGLRLLRASLAVVLLAAVSRQVHPGEALAQLRAAPLWIWPSTLSLFLVNTALYAARVSALMPQPAPLPALIRATLVANFAGLALPSGGAEAAKVVTIAPCAGGAQRALAFIAAARLIELVIWGGLVAWGAAAVLPGRLDPLVPVAWLSAAGFALGAAALALSLRHGGGLLRRLGPRDGLAGRLLGFASGVSEPFAAMAAAPGRLLRSGSWALLFALNNCLCAWLILRAYGLEIPYGEVLGLIPTLDIFLSLPLAPANLGVREVVFLNALEPYGASAAVALAVAYTRWAGHLGRAAIGGLIFAMGRHS